MAKGVKYMHMYVNLPNKKHPCRLMLGSKGCAGRPENSSADMVIVSAVGTPNAYNAYIPKRARVDSFSKDSPRLPLKTRLHLVTK